MVSFGAIRAYPTREGKSAGLAEGDPIGPGREPDQGAGARGMGHERRYRERDVGCGRQRWGRAISALAPGGKLGHAVARRRPLPVITLCSPGGPQTLG